MKRIIAIVLVLTLAFILVGCNIAPNVPGVSPYGTRNNNLNRGGWNDNDNDRYNNRLNGDRFNDNNFNNRTGGNTGRNITGGNMNNRIDTDDALNTREFYGERRTVNATDKALLQGR